MQKAKIQNVQCTLYSASGQSNKTAKYRLSVLSTHFLIYIVS